MIYAATIIIVTILFVIVSISLYSELRDNRRRVDEIGDNNRETKSVNKQTASTLDELITENRASTELNDSIREDNREAGDIIKGIRERGPITKGK